MKAPDEDAAVIVELPADLAGAIEAHDIADTIRAPLLRGPELAEVIRISVDSIAASSGLVILAMSRSAIADLCRYIARWGSPPDRPSRSTTLKVEYQGKHSAVALSAETDSAIELEQIIGKLPSLTSEPDSKSP